ncbi:protein kinase, putative [Bodo saltans]|uniref:Protein kinase, putative n=1 Tax=Bodo saltans TaxID=75058 RepID=A0A0S4J0A4_BODSA|nr:protein kinase, putative [Bodo saltans]|eukprot:CUG39081.1 protein kinase, putative [Bodo saltans]
MPEQLLHDEAASANCSGKFRNAKKLQEEYSFKKETDVIGSGAFSVVYRATPTSSAARAAVLAATVATMTTSQHHRHSRSSSLSMNSPSQSNNNNSPSQTASSNNSNAPPPAMVALKVISRLNIITEAESRQQRREVEREVGVLQKLSHSGCTMVIETLQTSEEYIIVMQLLDGCMDAGRYLKAYGPLVEEHAALVICQLLHTVKYLHRNFGLLHRDIKVENLILSPPVSPSPPTTSTLSTSVGGAALTAPSANTSSNNNNNNNVSGHQQPHAASSLVIGSVLPSPPSLEDLMAEEDRHHGNANNKVFHPSATTTTATTTTAATGLTPSSNTLLLPSTTTMPSSSSSAATMMRASPNLAIATADSGVIKHIRNYGRVTLVDFGLARWLPAPSSSSPQSAAAGGEPRALSPTPAGLSPVSPNPMPSRGCSSSSFTYSGGELFPSVPTTTDQHLQQQSIFMSCCGSDKYMAPEMLKWYIEHFSSTSSTSSMQGGGVGAPISAPPASAAAGGGPAAPSSAGTTTTNRKLVPIAHAMKMDVYSIGVVAYALLSGCLPYSGKTRAAIATQQQTTVALKMNSQHWHGVSSEAKRFVSRLLATDVLERCSIEEALDDAWLASPAALCSKLHVLPEPLLTATTAPSFSAPAQSSSSTASKTTAMLSQLCNERGGKSPSNLLSVDQPSFGRVGSAGGGVNGSRSGSTGSPGCGDTISGHALLQLHDPSSTSSHSAPLCHYGMQHHQHQQQSSSSSRSSACDTSSPCLPSGHPFSIMDEEPVALKMNSQHWHGVSSEAKRFVSRLLATDVLERCSIEEALDDAWLASPAALCSKLHVLPEPLLTATTAPSFSAPAQSSSSTASKTTAMLSQLCNERGGKSPSNLLSVDQPSFGRVGSAGGGVNGSRSGSTGSPGCGDTISGHALLQLHDPSSTSSHSAPLCHYGMQHHYQQHQQSSSSSRSSACDSSSPCLPSGHPFSIMDEEPPGAGGAVGVSFSKSSMRT